MDSELDREVGDVKRTPKADPVTGGQMGRPHPALRKYAANYEAVSLGEALERLGARKNGQLEAIKGGLDDNSKEVELQGPGAELPSANVTSHLDPKGSRSYDPFIGKVAEEEVHENHETETMDDVRLRLMGARPGSVEEEVPTAKKRKRRTEPQAPQIDFGLVEQFTRMKLEAEMAVEKLRQAKEVFSPSPPAPQDRDWNMVMKEPVPEPPKEKSSKVRVEISLEAMTFNVSAIDLVQCRFGATLFLPTSSDAMTFVPTVGAPVTITKQGEAPVRLKFTGVSFQVPGQEMMGLAFVRPAEEKTEDRDRPKGKVGDLVRGMVEV